jgi:hypothetical protein
MALSVAHISFAVSLNVAANHCAASSEPNAQHDWMKLTRVFTETSGHLAGMLSSRAHPTHTSRHWARVESGARLIMRVVLGRFTRFGGRATGTLYREPFALGPVTANAADAADSTGVLDEVTEANS